MKTFKRSGGSIFSFEKQGVVMLVGFFLSPLASQELLAAKISEIAPTELGEQVLRFFTFQDPALRLALVGSALLGVCCGLLGSFLIVRRMALIGDTLSHAVLPGVALGFMWNMSKEPVAIFVGASLVGLLGSGMVSLICRTTRLKEDTALGMVLATFFAVGMCLITMIQRLETGNKSGIDKFLFGQVAALSERDVGLMAGVTLLTLLGIILFYKEFLISSFDAGFSRAIGYPVKTLDAVLMLLLSFSVVVALQAVGVVLVSAMLITPAATAYLLTDRMKWMLVLSAVLGMFAGILGAFLSFLESNLPTGPLMVLAASLIFGVAFLIAPRQGVLIRGWRHWSSVRRVDVENTLKALFHVLEDREFRGDGITVKELAEKRRQTLEEAQRSLRSLKKRNFLTFHDEGQTVFLTPQGWEGACSIVRNHRLWELYLTHAAQIAPDHVHEEAEKIEHVLGEEIVQQLEKRLRYATRDPHGKLIPSSADIRRGIVAPSSHERAPGYGKESL